VDLEGDGRSELLVVRSGLDTGAALALFAVENGALRLVAQSEAFGQPNRWLNPIGTGDFDGDGGQEIAAVLTPHLGGTLTLYRRQGGRLIPKLSQPGFSNHAPGSRELGMSALLDLNNDGIPDLVVPDDSRERLRLVTFAGGQFRQLGTITHSAEIATGIAVADLDGNGLDDLIYALENGLVVLLVR
jgi:hypothetical protein